MYLVRSITWSYSEDSSSESTLLSTSVVLSSEVEWLVGSSYTVGNIVKVSEKKVGSVSDIVHHLYEALTSTTGDYPPDDVNEAVPKWVDLGADNFWKMFDGGVATQTVDTSFIQITAMPGRINTVGLQNVSCSSVSLVMERGGEVVYSQTQNLVLHNVVGWYEYFFEPIVRKTDIIFSGIPLYSDGVLTITLNGQAGESVACGLVVAGLSKNIGISLWGGKIGISDFSVKTEDAFGNKQWLRRNNSRNFELDLFVSWELKDEVFRILSLYTATPLLWVGSELISCTQLYAVVKTFQIVLESPEGVMCSLDLEGLV